MVSKTCKNSQTLVLNLNPKLLFDNYTLRDTLAKSKKTQLLYPIKKNVYINLNVTEVQYKRYNYKSNVILFKIKNSFKFFLKEVCL